MIYVTVFYISDYYQGKCDLEPGNQQSVPSNSVTEHRVHMTAERWGSDYTSLWQLWTAQTNILPWNFFTDIKILLLHPKYSTWPVEAVCLIPSDPPYYTDTQNNIWKSCFMYFLVHCSAFPQNNRLLTGNPAIYTLILPRVCFSVLLIWTEFEM